MKGKQSEQHEVDDGMAQDTISLCHWEAAKSKFTCWEVMLPAEL